MRRLVSVLLIGNLCLWLYFGLSFVRASEPYDPRPGGHLPVDPYSFWGHAIGLSKSSHTYIFVKAVFWPNLPSFFLVALFRNVFLRNVASDTMYGGISGGGYALFATMALSFVQWYSIGKIVEWLRRHSKAGIAPD